MKLGLKMYFMHQLRYKQLKIIFTVCLLDHNTQSTQIKYDSKKKNTHNLVHSTLKKNYTVFVY